MSHPPIQTEDFEYKGFQCTVVEYTHGETTRQILTSINNEWWCGYVVIPGGHEFYDKDYDDIDIDCHGGLTYSGKFHNGESKNSNKFAVGFDFQHFGDMGGSKEQAISECKQVVDQLTNPTK